MENKLKIFVITHKPIKNKLDNYMIPLQVGKVNNKLELDYLTDDTGENIASKNSNYCELTGLYWIWKNCHDYEYIGLCHYRRYFSDFFVKNNNFISYKKLLNYLNKYDVILPKKYYMTENVYKTYFSGSGLEKDIINTRNIINKFYPDYINSFDKICNSVGASYCNMFIISHKKLDEYCTWLFKILFELEKITDLNGYSIQQKRIYGYLSEILLNVWVLKNNLKVKYLPISKIEESLYKKISMELYYTKNKLLYSKIKDSNEKTK